MTTWWNLRFELEHHRHFFPLGNPHPTPQGIYFDGDYYQAYRYTEIQEQGLAYHEYGFWWDREEKWQSLVMPASIAELLVAGLQFGQRLYKSVGYWGLVDLEFKLVGVRDRQFIETAEFLLGNNQALDDMVSVRATDSVSALTANGVEVAKQLMMDISWAFGRQQCPASVTKYLDNASVS